MPHTPLAVSHASSGPQSLDDAQPQVPLDRHAAPELLPAHDEHIAPVAPHAMDEVPVAQVPALQHPPLQG